MTLLTTITTEIEKAGGAERLANILQAERLIIDGTCRKPDCYYCAWVRSLKKEEPVNVQLVNPTAHKIRHKAIPSIRVPGKFIAMSKRNG